MKKERKFVYGLIIGILVVLLLLTCYLLYYFYSNRDLSITKEYIKTNEEDYINFTIKLKDNDFITDSSKVTSYMTDMIEYVNVYYNYGVKYSEDVIGKVTVSSKATLVGNSNENNETLLYNEFYTTDESSYTVDGKYVNISDTYKLNFDNENKIYESFKDVNSLDLSGYIKYEVTINYNVYSELISDYITKTSTLYAIMPLGGETKIQLSDNGEYKDSKIVYAKMTKEQKPLYLAICLELFGACVLFVILILLIINQMKTTSSKYEKELDKIFSKYKKRIVKLKSVPDLSDKNVVLVKSLEDLDNVSKVKNVNYVEVIENKLSIFIIYENDTAYVYNFDAKKVK